MVSWPSPVSIFFELTHASVLLLRHIRLVFGFEICVLVALYEVLVLVGIAVGVSIYGTTGQSRCVACRPSSFVRRVVSSSRRVRPPSLVLRRVAMSRCLVTESSNLSKLPGLVLVISGRYGTDSSADRYVWRTVVFRFECLAVGGSVVSFIDSIISCICLQSRGGSGSCGI